MTNAEPVSDSRNEAVTSWTCARCEMTLSFSPDVEKPRLPATWVREDGELYCLRCRRDRAADAGLDGVDEDVSTERRTQIRSWARVEFEIKRDPERQDSMIAKACGTSTFSVRKARDRLGLETPDRA